MYGENLQQMKKAKFLGIIWIAHKGTESEGKESLKPNKNNIR